MDIYHCLIKHVYWSFLQRMFFGQIALTSKMIKERGVENQSIMMLPIIIWKIIFHFSLLLLCIITMTSAPRSCIISTWERTSNNNQFEIWILFNYAFLRIYVEFEKKLKCMEINLLILSWMKFFEVFFKCCAFVIWMENKCLLWRFEVRKFRKYGY